MIAVLEQDNNVRRIQAFLLRADKDFTPPISSRVDLSAYSEKLGNMAINLFIEIDGQDVGHAAVYVNDKVRHIAFLSYICVLSDCNGKRLGEQLLRQVIMECQKRAISSLRLEVNCGNKAAIAFYIRHGFVQCEALTSDRLTMTKKIEAAFSF